MKNQFGITVAVKSLFRVLSRYFLFVMLATVCCGHAWAAQLPAYPVIFVHGIGIGSNNSTTWKDFGQELHNHLGWKYGGALTFNDQNNSSWIDGDGTGVGDYYTINFTNGNELYIPQQAYQLRAAISTVLQTNPGKKKVILVGHSMGGLASRAYLQGLADRNHGTGGIQDGRVKYKDDVAQLITIGTPHLGAGISTAALSIVGIPGLIKSTLFDSVALIELEGLRSSSTLLTLDDLAANPLPPNVVYHSVVAKAAGNFSFSRLTVGGDGIVPAKSQNMQNIGGAGGLPGTINHTSEEVSILDHFFYIYCSTESAVSALLFNHTQVHTCETSNRGVWNKVLENIIPDVTDASSTIAPVLNTPNPTMPAYGSANLRGLIPLTWSAVSGADYRVMISENRFDLPAYSNASKCLSCTFNITVSKPELTIPASALKSGTTYYWQVKARSFDQVSLWSPVMTFTTAPLPTVLLSPPVQSTPVNSASGETITPNFSWSEVSGASSYRVEVADHPSKLTDTPYDPVCSTCVVNDTTYFTNYVPPTGVLKPGVTYYWQVKGRGQDYGAWSTQRSFSTAALATDTTPPRDGSLAANPGDGQVVLSWKGFFDDGSGISSYKFVFSTGSPPANCNAGTLLFTGMSSSVIHNGLVNGTPYYYRVCAIDEMNNMSAGAVANATPQQQQAVQGGALRISITPAGAPVIAGAQWKLSTESIWRNSDETILELPSGNYTVQFKPISGWSTPPDQLVIVAPGNMNWYDGNAYVLTSGGVSPPSNLQAFPNSDGSMSFTWTDNSNNEDFFNLYYSTSGAAGPFNPTSIGTGLLANTTSFTVGSQAFTMGQRYCFRLMAYQNATALSSYSNIICEIPNVTVAGSFNTVPFVASGGGFQIAMKADGTLWSWGAGSLLQTGYAASGDRSYPGSMLLSDVVKISSGGYHSLAIKPDGRVFSWGANSDGQLGNGTTTQSTPKQVTGLAGITAVAAGYSHSVAVRVSDGSVWTWGSNTNGELGDSGAGRPTPGLVSGLSGVVAVSAGSNVTVAVKGDGSVWAWGRNNNGEAGVYGGLNQYSPQRILIRGTNLPLTGVVKVASGQIHNMALKADGTVWSWGDGTRLGANLVAGAEHVAVQAVGLTGVIDIAAGWSHSLALKKDGTVWAWGANAAKQLGVAGSGNAGSPIQVPGLSAVIAISAATEYSVALKSDGTIVTWGTGSSGVLGTGTYSNATPMAVIDSAGSGTFQLFTTPRPFVLVDTKALTFPTTATNSTSPTQAVTLTNIGGVNAELYWVGASSEFVQSNTCGVSLAPSASCSINVAFTPLLAGVTNGALNITSNATHSPHSVSLSGTGVELVPKGSLSTTLLSFADLNMGTTSAAQTLTLTNTGSAALSISRIAVSGDYALTHNCPDSLAIGANCTISVTFAPAATGFRSGTLAVISNATSSPHRVNLSGTGVALAPKASLSTTTLSFANRSVGTTSAAQSVTLTNTGSAALNIFSIAVTGDYALTNSCLTLLAAGANCTMSVTFTPVATGARNGAITIISDAADSPQIVSLTGVGESSLNNTNPTQEITVPQSKGKGGGALDGWELLAIFASLGIARRYRPVLTPF